MSRTVYTYRADHTAPVGSFGPLDEWDMRSWEHRFDCAARYFARHPEEDMATYVAEQMPRTIEPTPEQERAAGWFNGANMSNTNAAMVLRALDLDPERSSFDPVDLIGRITLARGLDSVDDSGFAASQNGNVIDCGVRPGYFADRFSSIEEVAYQAIEWDAEVIFA